MLFNSYEFLFAYLPVVFTVFFLIARWDRRLAAFWLALASLFFYGYWDSRYVILLMASIAFNYKMGCEIAKAVANKKIGKKYLLAFSISANLALLAYYKYSNFFIDGVEVLTEIDFPFQEIVLPLGISFFTFTQIAFLVDVHRGLVREYNFIHYLLFVTYFPHLIAGPVLHHKQMMPQFEYPGTYRIRAENLAVGVTLFAVGLFKKVVIADNFALYASPVFDGAQHAAPSFWIAWMGVLAYTFQIYFDFSGYSDMAVGLSKLFGIDLPINFNSPYKSKNIIEFWRRWHMTLSQFLRDYLYIPLGGNRKSVSRRYINLMITMLLGGLWHGANWTFVVWGGLHGFYLVVNHVWNITRSKFGLNKTNSTYLGKFVGGTITFLAVAFAWVFFRADSVSTAGVLLTSMLDFSTASEIPDLKALVLLSIGGAIAFFGVNSNQLVESFKRIESIHAVKWQRIVEASGAVVVASVLYLSTLMLTQKSEFLYFQF